MKSLRDCLNESLDLSNEIKKLGIWYQHKDNSFSVCISEKNFDKLSKNKNITTPYVNKSIKILDNTKIKYHVIPNGSTAFITKMKDEEKSWYLSSGDLQKYKNETIFVIKLYSTGKESSSWQPP